MEKKMRRRINMDTDENDGFYIDYGDLDDVTEEEAVTLFND